MPRSNTNPNSLVNSVVPAGVPQWIESLRNAMYDSINEGDVTAIMQQIVKKAKEGDLASQKLVLDYVLGGRPTKVVNQTLVMGPEPERPARRPTTEKPGTLAKLEVMAKRARKGRALHHPEDAA